MEIPSRDCPRCPRLMRLRAENRARQPGWHNAPVASFGALEARLLIVGLAPGQRGANRTGRPFTGDFAGDLLYRTLLDGGFARGSYACDRGDGGWAGDSLELVDCRIANAVRCLPPENKPTPEEIAACRPFLATEIQAMPRLRVILALGRIAHEATLSGLGRPRAKSAFAHGRIHDLGDGLVLADSYHCSRYNTQTGRLTPAMFAAVVKRIRNELMPG